MKKIVFSVDVEQDCPPFLTTTRGLTEGLPKLLALLKQEAVLATFFVTGQSAEQVPQLIEQLLAEGHELGCHGHTHRRFDQIDISDAKWELETACNALYQFNYQVTSFRAPNLLFPEDYVPLLEKYQFQIDSSLAAYKPPYTNLPKQINGLTRIPVSMTSSMLRLPQPLLKWSIQRLLQSGYPVFFVHPWEFVDMRATGIRLDCRFNTGLCALKNLHWTIDYVREHGWQFVTMRELSMNLCLPVKGVNDGETFKASL